MTDAKHLTPHEPGAGTGTGTGTGTGADSGAGTSTGIPASAHAPAHAAAPAHAPTRTAPDSVLLPQDERDKLGLRLQQALSTFVESPRQAVEEADSLFDDAVRHLTETLTERRRTLRASWQGQDTEAQTEELRLALRQYRESMERLLRI